MEVPRAVEEGQGLPMMDATVLIELLGGVRIEMSQATEPKWLAGLLRELGTVACLR